jgi:hypothetical protein
MAGGLMVVHALLWAWGLVLVKSVFSFPVWFPR